VTLLLTPKMRLDVYLADRGLVDSRTDAKKFVLAGNVTVDGSVVQKPSFAH
jgi:predicted rRNA methylase YqxC with S4 and FtsJ domains